ncbi:MAG: hypothetical protein RBU21_05945 [FCB group bacterium]|jgi:hypothetical protein|nr:hypothetical protein [FCB group bacterium]
MGKAKAIPQMEVEIQSVQMTSKDIQVKAVFDASKTNWARIYEMRPFKAQVIEPARGVERPAIEEVYCLIDAITLQKPKKDKEDQTAKVTLTFDDTHHVVEALEQVRRCVPPTMLLIQTQLEIDFDDDDGGGGGGQLGLEE